MYLQIINVVWGEKYINNFLHLALPTQFSPGNLTDLNSKPHYIIYTNKEGKAQITGSSIYKKLEESSNVIFRKIKTKIDNCCFKTMMKCQSDSITQANTTSSPIVFLSPDCIVSSGVFTYLEEALKRRKRLVAICSSRMSLEKYEKIVKEKEGKFPHDNVNWSSRDLAKITIRNLHHRAKCLLMNGVDISIHPSHMYWKLDENNLLAKAYHLHPLLIWPKKHNILPLSSTDGKQFLEKICPNYDEWDVIADCNKISLFEISSDKQFTEDTTEPIDKLRFKQWIHHNVSEAHLHFIKYNIILGDGIRKPEWEGIIDNANRHLKDLHHITQAKPAIQAKPTTSTTLTNLYRKHLLHYLVIIKWYGILFWYILTGKKKVTFKKIYCYIVFLFKNWSFPHHTLQLNQEKLKHRPNLIIPLFKAVSRFFISIKKKFYIKQWHT